MSTLNISKTQYSISTKTSVYVYFVFVNIQSGNG